MSNQSTLKVELHYINGTKEIIEVIDSDYIEPGADEGTLTIYDLKRNRHCIPYNCLLKWVELHGEYDRLQNEAYRRRKAELLLEEPQPMNFKSYAEMEERINEVLKV